MTHAQNTKLIKEKVRGMRQPTHPSQDQNVEFDVRIEMRRHRYGGDIGDLRNV